MANNVYSSAGVFHGETDLSGQVPVRPFGIPAGIIGTSLEGPAFVPVTLPNWEAFRDLFGQSDGEKFGPIAVAEWIRNARAVTYIKLLGVGDAKQKSTVTGIVSRAGFVVGQQEPQKDLDGLIGANQYANPGGVPGRTYFLMAMMSESNGCTVFTDAGLQNMQTGSVLLRGVVMTPSGVIPTLSGGFSRPYSNDDPGAAFIATGENLMGSTTGSLNVSGSAVSNEFVMLLNGYKGSITNPSENRGRVLTASLDPSSDSYITKVFNTDPLKIEEKGHLLYSHYDIPSAEAVCTGSGLIHGGDSYTDGGYFLDNAKNARYENVVLLCSGALARNTTTAHATAPNYENFETRFTTSKSPFVISQANVNLFRIHALDDGQVRTISWAGDGPVPVPGANDKLKISIREIAPSEAESDPYGRFEILVRNFYDVDQASWAALEKYTVSLDPNADDYISRVIGDMYTYFDFDQNESEQRLVVQGSYPNLSNYIRIEVAPAVGTADVAKDSLPLGFRGPNHLLLSGTTALTGAADPTVYRGIPGGAQDRPCVLANELPVPFRRNLVAGSTLVNPEASSDLFWGVQFERLNLLTQPNFGENPDPTVASMTSFFPDFCLNGLNVSTGSNPGDARVSGGILDCDVYNNNKFSLLNIQVVTGSSMNASFTGIDSSQRNEWTYVRRGNIVANEANKTRGVTVSDFNDSSNRNFLKFSFMVQGGFNGLDMFDANKQKMNNTAVRREMADIANEAQSDSATVAAYLQALSIMGNTSDVDIQLLAIPGIRESIITNEAINTTEDRFDALYIMDIQERDELNNVVTSSAMIPNVANTATAFRDRALNSSFAAAYFPDVKIEDPSDPGLIVEGVPPTVAVLGTFSRNDELQAPWFAPAGVNRGNLTTVTAAELQLELADTDKLYQARINPLRTFPGEAPEAGVVVFGQKTLQAAQTALDRINVRRLLIYIRRQVRAIANTFLFEPNRESTLAAFSSAVQPILSNVQQRQGLTNFTVIIDASTTTQADVENNTVRGKIFLQPTYTVEFVSLDFVITNAGAEV